MVNSYKEFIEELRQALVAATGLGEEKIYFKEAEEYPQTSGDRLFVECATGEKAREVYSLYTETLYSAYCAGTAIEDMVKITLQDLEDMKAAGIIEKAQKLHDYEKIRSDLFIRLLNLDKNKEKLKKSVYRTVGDIALVLYIKMGSFNGVASSLKVTREMAAEWGKECNTVFENALMNTFLITPPRIFQWEKLLIVPDYSGDPFMDGISGLKLSKGPIGNCLSTSERTNGAVAAFLPGVADRLASLMGGGYYLVFTSIHEVMIHSKESADPEDLKRVLKETVEEATLEEDFLTYKIYQYTFGSGEISVVGVDEE